METATTPKSLNFLLFGAGFWASYQLAAWHEQARVRCIGIWDPDRDKARALADRFQIARVFTEPDEALTQTTPDFVDIVTPPRTHRELVLKCAARRLPVICQKPLAETWHDAETMVAACADSFTPLLVHENWRWQKPLRFLGERLHQGAIGTPFRARLQFTSSFPVFENQPFLATLDKFILSDVGPHILDVARFLFGDAQTVYCQTRQVNSAIRGEDVATVMLDISGITVTCELSYATRWRGERFPQTYALIEGTEGSLELGEDYLVQQTHRNTGSWRDPHAESWRVTPPRYTWADPDYDLVQASMVPCQADLLRHLRGQGESENTGSSNLETLRLVFAAYESAATGNVVHL